ncbi:MAG: phosphonate ABC transporter, permease protein PhnE [Rhodobacter sp.]|nr:phosphonate ABC transporter, permease protein PhnE [Rhodobacter sp.]
MSVTDPPMTMQANVLGLFAARRRMSFLVPGVILAYLIYIFFAFDIPGLAQRARMDNAAILMSDFWIHKTHVTRDNRTGAVTVSIDGEARATYPAGKLPEWVTVAEDQTTISLPGGHGVVYDAAGGAQYRHPDYGVIDVQPRDGTLDITLPDGPVPDWISLGDNRISVTTDQGRFSMTRNRTETFRYKAGWALFFFTLDSPFHGKSPGELAALAVSGDRVDPARSNLSHMVSDFWNNGLWRHKDVAWAIFETILMAFLGTFAAAIISLPLAFFAATNFTSIWAVRFGMRRVFDFVRGVDSLIWTIILARAFGPGPMTGALAILITDIGTFGKQFSETLENIDDKQVEGIRSTGANAVQRARFGVLPQITPVLLAQVLYMLESNTRSATVIGAIVGGGIGLLLTQAISTQKDWEDVAYYLVLIVLMVIMMDTLSGWLRRKLIKGDAA